MKMGMVIDCEMVNLRVKVGVYIGRLIVGSTLHGWVQGGSW